MKENLKKNKVLIVSGYFLPGFKHGGIQRTIINTIDHLNEYYDFKVITRDHDVNEKYNPYKNIKLKKWNLIKKIKVKYLNYRERKFFNFLKIINSIDYDIIHLNSFFDPLSVYILIGNRFRLIRPKKIILSNRGEFAWASLKIRYFKKFVYLIFFKLFKLEKGVVWHVSTKYEKKDLLNYFKIYKKNIITAIDLPKKIDVKSKNINKYTDNGFSKNQLRLIFLSRISPEKNLDYVIKVLSKLKIDVKFSIYGTIQDKKYWIYCTNLLDKLPKNIIVKFLGAAKPNDVEKIFSKHDLFFFPSGGENYSHVISESLSVGTPVLISKNTPWRNLKQKSLGWDVSLGDQKQFKNILENYSKLSKNQVITRRKKIIQKISKTLVRKKDLEINKKIFLI